MKVNNISQWVNDWIGNPFSNEPLSKENAASTYRRLKIKSHIEKNLLNGKIAEAKRIILAFGHAQACETPHNPDKVLPPELFDEAIFERLPRGRSDYRRIVMAAGRCYSSLTKLAGDSEAMALVRNQVWSACFGGSLLHLLELERVVRDHDVVILGETGTGKELVASALLAAIPGDSSGNHAPSASLNAAAIPETLIESELFGHVKGAFTGAMDPRSGRIRSAHQGALFLDEVGDLPLTTQVKLLRVIESNEVNPVGSDDSYHVDVRYIAATHKDLEAMVESRSFRRDLYERLAGKVIRLPPLRERPEDILEIGRLFITELRLGPNLATEVDKIEEWLAGDEARHYPWYGNVRELQNALRNMVLGLPPGLRAYGEAQVSATSISAQKAIPRALVSGQMSMTELQLWYGRKMLARHGGNYAATSRAMGIDRSTLKRWCP